MLKNLLTSYHVFYSNPVIYAYISVNIHRFLRGEFVLGSNFMKSKHIKGMMFKFIETRRCEKACSSNSLHKNSDGVALLGSSVSVAFWRASKY